MNVIEKSKAATSKAYEVINTSKVKETWEAAGAEVRLVKVASPLFFSVSNQLMKIPRFVSDIFKRRSCDQSPDSLQKELGSDLTKLLEEFRFVAHQLLKLFILKRYIHTVYSIDLHIL